jgi:ABC-2 type transport system permease protein
MNKIVKHGQLWQLILANSKEMLREPGILFWGIAFPILMSLGLGIAFTKKADTVRKIAVISKQAIQPAADSAFNLYHFLRIKAEKTSMPGDTSVLYKITIPDDKLGNTTFLFHPMDSIEAMIMLKRGNIGVILEQNKGKLIYHFDPLNPDAQLTYLKLVSMLGEEGDKYGVRNTAYGIRDGNHIIEPLTVSGTRYIDFLVPGLIAMGIMMSCMWGLSYGIIEKRSKKLLRRMVATPMKKSHFLIALITVRMMMNFLEALLLFIFAWLVFGITITGSVAALIMLMIAGNMAFAGIAVFISSHTSNTEIGNGFINAVVMPMMVLSGIFFSYHNFPDWSIGVIRKFPLTMLADGIRSVFIEGAGFSTMTQPILVLLAIGIVFFTIGLKIFKWH